MQVLRKGPNTEWSPDTAGWGTRLRLWAEEGTIRIENWSLDTSLPPDWLHYSQLLTDVPSPSEDKKNHTGMLSGPMGPGPFLPTSSAVKKSKREEVISACFSNHSMVTPRHHITQQTYPWKELDWQCGSMVECLPGMLEDGVLIPALKKDIRKGKKIDRRRNHTIYPVNPITPAELPAGTVS